MARWESHEENERNDQKMSIYFNFYASNLNCIFWEKQKIEYFQPFENNIVR